jgi:hypothetical protein
VLFASIDPGKKHAGVALWAGGVLVRAYLVGPAEEWLSFLKELPPQVSRGVIEIPQIFPGEKARHEDLIQLAVSAGAIAGAVKGQWTQARPAKWTRETCSNKEIRIERALKLLSDTEHQAIEWPSTKLRKADVGDAIALGLWALKRF